ncbi:terminase small subunit [Achromobacter sp.]|uniref:terminase small subunit n=1 Tax=Achromobacter sp. TaxID=134375 RepID=UPI00258997A3|nr:terminase small subunit [Achromobacter sp.]
MSKSNSRAPKSARKSPARPKRTLSTAARRVVSADSPLTPQQRRFVDEFAAGGFLNQTKAYEAAYRARGAAAISGASRLLNQANVAAAVQGLRDKLSAKLEVTAQRVLEEWVAMGFYDAADLVVTDENGVVRDITSPKDLRLLPERVRRCIVGWSWDRNGNFTLKLAPKTPNLELIGRYLGMFVERKELRLGDLDKKSDAELDAAIAQAAQEIAQAEGIPVEKVLAQLRAGGAGAGTTMH